MIITDRRHIRLSDMTEDEARALILEGMGAIRGVDPYDKRLSKFSEAYAKNRTGLRMDRQTWTVRDNSGWLSRPSDRRGWPECTKEDARFELARHVWCDAVRLWNIENR